MFMSKHRPWSRAGVDRLSWERARDALIDQVADKVWRARSKGTSQLTTETDPEMQRLAEVGTGDRDATLYGLRLADMRHRRERPN